MFAWLKKLFSRQDPSPVALSKPQHVEKSGCPTKPCLSCGKEIPYDPAWKHIPNYCADCKEKYRAEHPQSDRKMVRRTCRACGKTFLVPSNVYHKPNYCRTCKNQFSHAGDSGVSGQKAHAVKS